MSDFLLLLSCASFFCRIQGEGGAQEVHRRQGEAKEGGGAQEGYPREEGGGGGEEG